MHLLELLATLGAAQGLLLLALIALRFRHAKNTPLALLVLVFSLRLGTIPAWNSAALLSHPWLLPATTPLPFLFGPLLWWYTRELATDGSGRPRRLWLHALPYLAETAALVITLVSMEAGEYSRFVADVFTGNAPTWMTVRNGLKVLLNFAYMVLAIRIAFRKHEPPLHAARRLWLRALVLTPFASFVPFAFVALYSPASARLAEGSPLPFLILAAAMALLIYTFSMLILLAPDAPACGAAGGTRNSLSRMDRGECEEIAEEVERRLREGAFLDPELTVRRMGAQLRRHPNRVSMAVNYVYKQSFPKLLNNYRVSYFSDRVRDGALNKQTILELALEAGFSSKSTFNRVFKEHEGISPSEFAANQAAKQERLRGASIDG